MNLDGIIEKCEKNIDEIDLAIKQLVDDKADETLYTTELEDLNKVIDKLNKYKKHCDILVETYNSDIKDRNTELFKLGKQYLAEEKNKEAKDIFLQLAEQNNHKSMEELSNIYNLEKNYKESIKWLEELLKYNKDVKTYTDIGVFSYIDKQYKKCRKSLEIALKLDESNLEGNINTDEEIKNRNTCVEFATICLGNIYYYGLGIEKDYEKAQTYYEISAKLNNHYATFKLGEIYYNGYLDFEKNYSKSIKYYEILAEEDNADALYKLGEIYYNGDLSTEIDYKKARQYYRLAAEEGHIDAMIKRGDIEHEGKGVPINHDEAYEWYYKAYIKSGKRNNIAAYKLALTAGHKDEIFWYEEAIRLGNEEAIHVLNQLEMQYSYKDLFSLIREAYENGYMSSSDYYDYENGYYMYLDCDDDYIN